MAQGKKTVETEEKAAFKIQPLQKLEGIDFNDSPAFVCDMETGICGPANQEQEKKDENNDLV